MRMWSLEGVRPAAARARKATRADLAHITDTLALAFYDDQ
jgi:hypothetical protein